MYDTKLYVTIGAILSVILIVSTLFTVISYLISDHLKKDDELFSKVNLKDGIQYIFYAVIIMIIYIIILLFMLSKAN